MGLNDIYRRYRYWGGIVGIGFWGGVAGMIGFSRFYGLGEIAPFWLPIVVGGMALAGSALFVALFFLFQWIVIDALKSFLGTYTDGSLNNIN